MSEETVTVDGARVQLQANINLLSEIGLALELKAEGVGLYRSEFPFMIRASLPSISEQEHVYRTLFERMEGRDVTIRTLDAGGDKVLAYLLPDAGSNPALGLRSVRLSLKHLPVFEQQIEAILLAAGHARAARIMFPMISSLDEFRECREVVKRVHQRLMSHDPAPLAPKVGLMVEMPAAVEVIDEIAAEVDFISIGTNDLVQYMLAVDRANASVADYYCSHHPAVLRSLRRIVSATLKADCPVSVCGEMAHDSRYLPFLIGIGIRTVSIDPNYLPQVQSMLQRLNTTDAEAYASKLLALPTLAEVSAALREF
jgi:phosphotransferase system enzyme I (PtsP)